MQLSFDSTVELMRGSAMPRLGFGTYKSRPGDEVEHAVEFALRNGYRSVDTASLYGNEEGVGAGIRASEVPRSQVFLTSKVWNDEQGYDETLAALERSLSRLGTDYLDLYLVHWPNKARMADTWRAMERAMDEGLVREIGVCNHLPHHLERLLSSAERPPALDQIEFHPWLQQPQLQAYLAEHDIVLEAWAPLMKGRVGEAPELAEIGGRHGKSAAQIALRWILQLGYVTIPKSVHDERIIENSAIFDFELTDKEMAAIDALDRGHRFGPDPDAYAWE